jgi:hypothetical protein
MYVWTYMKQKNEEFDIVKWKEGTSVQYNTVAFLW